MVNVGWTTKDVFLFAFLSAIFLSIFAAFARIPLACLTSYVEETMDSMEERIEYLEEVDSEVTSA